MLTGRAPSISVLIATYNRANLLADTLDTLALSAIDRSWEVVVVDNNSSDRTRQVVEARVGTYPVPLRYLFEARQGKSVALNSALASLASDIIAFTDDDVRIPAGWLRALTQPLFDRDDIEYTGGPVRPRWTCGKPRWLDESGDLGGTIAVNDYGPSSFIFEERRRTPLGVNMSVRRSLIGRIGGFRADLGRRGNSLLGQEQAEFFCRSRADGARGLYVPDAVLAHVVPEARLTRRYFARWWFWKGISRARLHRIHPVTELGLDLRMAPYLGGVPRYMYRSALRHGWGWARSWLVRDRFGRMRHAMALAYLSGYWWEQQRCHPTGRTTPAQIEKRRSQPA